MIRNELQQHKIRYVAKEATLGDRSLPAEGAESSGVQQGHSLDKSKGLLSKRMIQA